MLVGVGALVVFGPEAGMLVDGSRARGEGSRVWEGVVVGHR